MGTDSIFELFVPLHSSTVLCLDCVSSTIWDGRKFSRHVCVDVVCLDGIAIVEDDKNVCVRQPTVLKLDDVEVRNHVSEDTLVQ